MPGSLAAVVVMEFLQVRILSRRKKCLGVRGMIFFLGSGPGCVNVACGADVGSLPLLLLLWLQQTESALLLGFGYTRSSCRIFPRGYLHNDVN